MTEKTLLSQTQIARDLHKDRRTVSKRLENVIPAETKRNAKLFALRDIVAAFGADFALPAGAKGITIEEARRRKEVAQACLLEMQVKQQEGKLVDPEEITAEMVRFVTNAKTRLLAIPSKAAPVAAHKPAAEVFTVVKAEIYDALTELSNKYAGPP